MTRLNAMHYLDFFGSEIDRAKFVSTLTDDDDEGFLLRISAKLTIAVIALSTEDAVDTVETWLNDNKPDDLTDGRLPEEVRIETVTI